MDSFIHINSNKIISDLNLPQIYRFSINIFCFALKNYRQTKKDHAAIIDMASLLFWIKYLINYPILFVSISKRKKALVAFSRQSSALSSYML
jgi:hypothetical protein